MTHPKKDVTVALHRSIIQFVDFLVLVALVFVFVPVQPLGRLPTTPSVEWLSCWVSKAWQLEPAGNSQVGNTKESDHYSRLIGVFVGWLVEIIGQLGLNDVHPNFLGRKYGTKSIKKGYKLKLKTIILSFNSPASRATKVGVVFYSVPS